MDGQTRCRAGAATPFNCAEKYGQEKWAEYQETVPYRIIPGIY